MDLKENARTVYQRSTRGSRQGENLAMVVKMRLKGWDRGFDMYSTRAIDQDKLCEVSH